MRKALLLAPALLAACSTAPAAPIIHGQTPGHKCDKAGTEAFIGKAGTKVNGAAIKRASHAAVLRWAPPGYAMTMDFREDRVTIWLDEARRITKISCG